MTNRPQDECKRPYSLGLRREKSDSKRAAILAEARVQLEQGGLNGFSLEALSRAGGITRQTVYNLFGTRTGLLEALFDQIAIDGGMERMREVMQQPNSQAILSAFGEVFCIFWSRHRTLLRRIHGIAAIDPEFGRVVEARNQRRLVAATRVVQRLGKGGEGKSRMLAAALYSLTSFEFFDALVTALDSEAEAVAEIQRLLVASAA